MVGPTLLSLLRFCCLEGADERGAAAVNAAPSMQLLSECHTPLDSMPW